MDKRKGNLIVGFLIWVLACPLLFGGTLVVLNKSDHEAALVDPAVLMVVARIPTGVGPHEAAVSPDGRYAYVSNYGAFGMVPGGTSRGGPGNTITVIDLKGRRVKSTFDLGTYERPHGIRVSRDGGRLWVTCEGAQAVLELDAATGSVKKIWKTEQQTSHMIVSTPDESKLYVANIGSGSVTVIHRASGRVTSIPVGPGSEGIDIAPDGKEVWVATRGNHRVTVIDTARDEILSRFDSGGEMPIRVKFSPDGKEVLVSNAESNSVSIFSAANRKLVDRVRVGSTPVGILITPDGRRAFVANTTSNQVTVVDVRERKVVATFTTGHEPDGMAWAN